MKLDKDNDIRPIIERYLDGTATPEEMEKLQEAALDALESEVPESLESRLSRHISALAAEESAVPIRRPRRLGTAGWYAAAACAAVLLTVGLSHIPGKETSSGLGTQPLSGLTAQIHEEKAGKPETPAASETGKEATTSVAVRAVNPEAVGTVKRGGAVRKGKKEGSQTHIPEGSLPELSMPVEVAVIPPEVLSPLSEIMPILAEATINPSEVVTQPFSTLNQAFDNVFEAVGALSTALSMKDAVLLVHDEVGKISM